ncbi:MAG: Cys-Gln thioester bond-forming surface protein [Phycisphaeraceae bacterium]|nr:Cys-Gln thioester bond-forming surface protein [Phycisphaeraceae bacterium]
MKISTIAAFAGLASVCSLASAAFTVEATYIDTNPGVWGSVSLNSGGSFMGPVKAGQFNWQRTGGTYSGLTGTFATFCIEVHQDIFPGNNYTYDVNTVANAPLPVNILYGTPMGAAKADQISELYGRFFAGLSTNDQYAAFQLAIWDFVYDGGGGVGAGVFQASGFGAAMALADAWIAAVDGSGPRMAGLGALSSDDWQDQIFTPAPGSLALIGLGGLVATRRRR